MIENEVVVELKAVSQLEKIHAAQLLAYLRLTGKKVGLLLNFNVVLMRNGIKRLVNGL
jgi:GxxExxY protein